MWQQGALRNRTYYTNLRVQGVGPGYEGSESLAGYTQGR